MSETEQYPAALKVEPVPTAMVRIAEASHGIASRPSPARREPAPGYCLAWSTLPAN